MKYRIAGLLSLGLAAGAYSTLYNTASTSAQPPIGSSNVSSHEHDHDHAGHDHAHQQSSESPAPNADAITAPSGGPPPLPTTTPVPSTNQNGAIPRPSPSSVPADSPPSLLPPNTGADYSLRSSSHVCPNATQRNSQLNITICPLEVDGRPYSVESCGRQSAIPDPVLNLLHRQSVYVPNLQCEYGFPEYPTSSNRASDPHFNRFGHEVNEHAPIWRGY